MYSVKPGRGPSIAGGIGGLVAAAFGVFWCTTAADAGAPGPFVAFGVVFIFAALGGAIYNFWNAGTKNRASTFDITGPGEEPDPVATALGLEQPREGRPTGPFCVHCGAKTPAEGRFCPHCGKAKAP